MTRLIIDTSALYALVDRGDPNHFRATVFLREYKSPEGMLMSNHIEEVYADDHVMRKRIVGILRRYGDIDHEVDREVRARLRNVEEGTADWEIQYKRIAEQVRRNKGLI